MLSSVIVVNCRLQGKKTFAVAQRGVFCFCFAFMLRRYEDLQISLRQHAGARVNGINVIYIFLIPLYDKTPLPFQKDVLAVDASM